MATKFVHQSSRKIKTKSGGTKTVSVKSHLSKVNRRPKKK